MYVVRQLGFGSAHRLCVWVKNIIDVVFCRKLSEQLFKFEAGRGPTAKK